jgi:hypothetical protein
MLTDIELGGESELKAVTSDVRKDFYFGATAPSGSGLPH